MNTIANCPVTINDVDLAEKIFGKAKTMQNKPTLVVHNIVEIDGMPFLSTISKRIKYQTIEWLPEKTIDAYKSVLRNIICIYISVQDSRFQHYCVIAKILH
jgi:hypothetical protein